MRTTWTFHSAGRIVFGIDAVESLGDHLLELTEESSRVLIVTDPALVDAGVCERVREALRESGIESTVFDGGCPEPPLELAMTCAESARAAGAGWLLGLGGGSNMDLAKVTACVLAHGGHPRDYLGDCVVPGPVFPLACVPTTAGTGSEVTAASVLSDPERGIKVAVLSDFLRPRLSVVDPRLTVSCPQHVTADSGIDALTHAVEAFTAVDNEQFPLPSGERSVYQGRFVLTDLTAGKAIELVGQFLRRAVEDGEDLEAREGMSLAALLAGIGFSNSGVAAVHALEYPLGSAVKTSHGRGNGLLLPYVMDFNRQADPDTFAMVAALLGTEIDGLTDDAAAAAGVAAVETLKADIGIPARLRDVGVVREQLPEFAEIASGLVRILRVNTREASREDLESILNAAY
ncbi:MAG TPA: alcohol dehydrogenase [Planctomycetaceae bacterium]|nr:alcohol dehydrogenase [Planctomycetaceae bacterium]HCK55739.1 alcohol dehydrogenase [Planctomycetaceae bacterium]